MAEKDKNSILQRAGHDAGMTVPEGFFEQFAEQMSARLPEQEWEREAARTPVLIRPRTTWQRIRPYVYMAAMFAGIWLMMNMFTLFTPASMEEQLQQNEMLTQAFQDSSFVSDQEEAIESDLDDVTDEEMDEAMDFLYAQGVTADDLRAKARLN